MGMAVVTLKKGEGRLLKSGGMWIFDNEIDTVMGNFENGDIVLVHDFDGYPMGRGFINTNSKITVRLMTRDENVDINEELLEKRVRDAWEYRKKVVDTGCCRLIFAEADFLPGIVVDKFSDVLVVQSLALGIDRFKETIVELLRKVLAEDGITIRGVYERSDVKVRKQEGMEMVKGFIGPEFPTLVQIEENGVKYVVRASGVINGGLDDYSNNYDSVFCDLETLKQLLRKEYAGKVIPGQPKTKAGKALKGFYYTSLKVKADDIDHVNEVADVIRNMGYNVETNAEYLDSMKSQFAIVQAVLGGIGAVSLLVAAIGIANTMMMSIYERTKEIGVMKVLGCSLRNIREMFLLEAAFIGLLGGIAGNILSFVMSAAINIIVGSSGAMSMGTDSTISYIPWWLVLMSMVFAVLVGVLAGYFPAKRAMKLSPLAAIRNE